MTDDEKIEAALNAAPDETPQESQAPVEPNPTPDEPAEPQGEPANQAPQEPQPTPEGYVPKEKFVASAKESILNAERIRVANERIEQLTKTDTPTDEAMRLVYPEWDDLNDVTKKALIKTEAQEMNLRNLAARQEEINNRFKFEEDLATVIDSEPKLLGKETEFKKFAAKPANKGISAEVLAKAFLFDVTEEAPAPVQKGEALPQGSGGPRGDLKPNKVSLEDAAQIRKTDSKRYMELVKAGAIDDDDI